MKVIYNNLIPFKGYQAMNIFGAIFARKEYGYLDDITLNHEAIHTAQMKELLYVLFYVLYGIEYILKLIRYGNGYKAYKNLSFEREAYGHERDLKYLQNRKHYAQWK